MLNDCNQLILSEAREWDNYFENKMSAIFRSFAIFTKVTLCYKWQRDRW